MADYLTNTTDLTTVANAIRTKGGTSDTLTFPDGFAEAIEDIPSSAVVQALSVTENGTYTAPSGVDGYSPVTVNVSGGGGGTPTGLADLRNWQFIAGSNFDAQIQISYDASSDLNEVVYTGSGGFERLLFLSVVKPNKTYQFSFTMECEETLTYWDSSNQNEYAFVTKIPYYNSSYTTMDFRNYDKNSIYNRQGGVAKTGNFVNTPNTPTVYSCSFTTASYQVLSILWIDLGSLTDGATFHFKFSNIKFEEVTT